MQNMTKEELETMTHTNISEAAWEVIKNGGVVETIINQQTTINEYRQQCENRTKECEVYKKLLFNIQAMTDPSFVMTYIQSFCGEEEVSGGVRELLIRIKIEASTVVEHPMESGESELARKKFEEGGTI